ncbi:outer membrane porin, OprD family [Hydrogenimonas thermophila]|uniref:Outer membrane porin, OprD family n=2 Tax=Hydrogenimonas thermophila TaxID=223786 RepID=A0A1I5LP13_9BACT|nr:outer membrane porin, OprD family [Hydrogenimonas thermophila]
MHILYVLLIILIQKSFMAKILFLIVIIIYGNSVYGSKSIAEALKDGSFRGQLRLFYIDRNYNGHTNYHKSAFASGGYLNYKTGFFQGMCSGISFYSTNNFGIRSDNLPGEVLDPTLFGEGLSSYTIVGEAYLKYKYENMMLKIGRQKINTPMLREHDIRMIPNFYEAYLFISNDIKDITFTFAHITKFAAGTFANAYLGGISAATGGYSYINSDMGTFSNIGEYAVGIKTNGITFIGIKYLDFKNVQLQIWDYYVHNILNAIYLQGDYSFFVGSIKLNASTQYIKENNIGNALEEAKSLGNIEFDKINSYYLAMKLAMKYKNMSGYVAFSFTGANNNNVEGSSIINMWGSTLGFTNGMVAHHEFYSDTKSWKVGVAYNLKSFGINGNVSIYHCNFDLGEDNPYVNGVGWTAKESGFDIKYYPSVIKNIQFRFRGNFPRDFKYYSDMENLSWDEYRFIINYNF